jgi:hypothetical protein
MPSKICTLEKNNISDVTVPHERITMAAAKNGKNGYEYKKVMRRLTPSPCFFKSGDEQGH